MLQRGRGLRNTAPARAETDHRLKGKALMKTKPIIIAVALVALLTTGAVPVFAAAPTPASGDFDAIVDFSTLTLTPKGANCLLTVDGTLVFTGTIEGSADGTTTALVFATCDEVIANPGADSDVFHSALHFTGTIDGEPAEADVTYQGRSAPGGAIDGMLRFTNGAHAQLDAQAQIAVGGSYEGFVTSH